MWSLSLHLKYIRQRLPVLICHITGKFCVVDIQAIILVPDETPMKIMVSGIISEGIKFIFNLSVYIFIFSFHFAAFCFDYPYGTILLHNNIISVEQPLMKQSVSVNDGKVLLTSITILVDPLDIFTTFAVLFKKLL